MFSAQHLPVVPRCAPNSCGFRTLGSSGVQLQYTTEQAYGKTRQAWRQPYPSSSGSLPSLRFSSDGSQKIFESQFGKAHCQNWVAAFLGPTAWPVLFCLEKRCICHRTHRSIRREHEELSVTDNCRERIDKDPNGAPYVRFRTLSFCVEFHPSR